MLPMLGILIVAIGFAFRFNALLVVLLGGVVSGLFAGMSFDNIMAQFGEAFTKSRYIPLAIILTLPLIGLLERYGLKEMAERLIKKSKALTAGRVLLSYLFIRELSSALGINIGGHAQAVRPIVSPMAEGAANAKFGAIDEALQQKIKAHAALVDNVGLFFGEDIFIATGPVLFMKAYFDSAGMNISVWNIALWGIPTAICAFFLAWWRLHRLDQHIELEMGKKIQQPIDTSSSIMKEEQI